jgi:transglutaminase-like putative cysteine protease
MTALVRRLKIPRRYVSGYLFRDAKSKDRSSAGATHAWVEAFLGDVGWVAFDPTNQRVGANGTFVWPWDATTPTWHRLAACTKEMRKALCRWW